MVSDYVTNCVPDSMFPILPSAKVIFICALLWCDHTAFALKLAMHCLVSPGLGSEVPPQSRT